MLIYVTSRGAVKPSGLVYPFSMYAKLRNRIQIQKGKSHSEEKH